MKGFEANRYMLWLTRSTPRLTWCWTLSPAGPGRTRVVTRVRFHHAWMSPAAWRVLAADLGNFYAVRRALMDIKAGAEGAARKNARSGFLNGRNGRFLHRRSRRRLGGADDGRRAALRWCSW